MPKNPLPMHLKLSQKEQLKKTAQAAGDLTGNKVADKITEVSKTLPHSITETVTNEAESIGLDREMPKEKYIFPEKR